jgi:tRNA G18 (ribose-2'-O)-methylase SpoU
VNPLIKTVKPITSFKNPRVKFLRALRMRKYRQRERCFLAKGIRIVEEALTCGAPVETLVYAPDLLVSERARALVGRVECSRLTFFARCRSGTNRRASLL